MPYSSHLISRVDGQHKARDPVIRMMEQDHLGGTPSGLAKLHPGIPQRTRCVRMSGAKVGGFGCQHAGHLAGGLLGGV